MRLAARFCRPLTITRSREWRFVTQRRPRRPLGNALVCTVRLRMLVTTRWRAKKFRKTHSDASRIEITGVIFPDESHLSDRVTD